MYSESFRLNRSRSTPPIVHGRNASSTGSTWLSPMEIQRVAGVDDAEGFADPDAELAGPVAFDEALAEAEPEALERPELPDAPVLAAAVAALWLGPVVGVAPALPHATTTDATASAASPTLSP